MHFFRGEACAHFFWLFGQFPMFDVHKVQLIHSHTLLVVSVTELYSCMTSVGVSVTIRTMLYDVIGSEKTAQLRASSSIYTYKTSKANNSAWYGLESHFSILKLGTVGFLLV